ncbi:hypothetical protein CMV_011950, partial [Castanea mollissima]
VQKQFTLLLHYSLCLRSPSLSTY